MHVLGKTPQEASARSRARDYCDVTHGKPPGRTARRCSWVCHPSAGEGSKRESTSRCHDQTRGESIPPVASPLSLARALLGVGLFQIACVYRNERRVNSSPVTLGCHA